MTSAAVVLVTIATVLGPGPASAAPAPPTGDLAEDSAEADPAARRVIDANLETTERRRGLTLSAAIGPSLTIGADTGTGGAVSLRLGQVATPTTVIGIELNGSAVLHKVDDRRVANGFTSFVVGVQHWVAPSLYIRISGGIGAYQCNECGAPDAAGMRRTLRYAGAAGGAGVGKELVRIKRAVLSLEISSMNLLSRDGLLSNNTLGLGLAFD